MHTNIGGIFKQTPALFGAQIEHIIDQSLVDNGVRAPEGSGRFLDVAQAHFGFVDEIFVFARAGAAAGDGDGVEGQGQGAIAVVDGQRYFGEAGWGAAGTATKDEVFGFATTQGGIALLAQHPTHGVDHIAFATAVGTDDGRYPRAEFKDGLGRKGFESLDFESL